MASLQEYLRRVHAVIASVGWDVIHVLPTHGDDAGFSYTVGLSARRHPEFLIAGSVPRPAKHSILNTIATRTAEQSTRYSHGQRLGGVLSGYDVVIVEAMPSDPQYPVGLRPSVACNLYGDDVRVQQLVWPDPEGRYPWDAGYDTRYLQPVIARP